MGLNPAKLVQPSVGWAPFWKESPSANSLTPAIYPGRVRNIGRLGFPLGGMGGPILLVSDALCIEVRRKFGGPI
jgi:hypothetical protein